MYSPEDVTWLKASNGSGGMLSPNKYIIVQVFILYCLMSNLIGML